MLLKQEEADGGLRRGRGGYLDVIGQGQKEQAANELCRMFLPQMAALPIRMRDRRVMTCKIVRENTPGRGSVPKTTRLRKQCTHMGEPSACDRLEKADLRQVWGRR